ncbi:MAG: sigma-70 family RNA polymerase sigma factor [Mycobacteriales bacterium]
MDEQDLLARRFEAHRGRLRAVAYRMLGSLSEADDALQEAWLKVSRADTSRVENLAGWLTTVVGRVCLDMLRSRTARREEPLELHLPDPIVSDPDAIDPEDEVLLADSVGLALLVVLESLRPAERLAFVLHDMFAVPFDDIGPILGRSPAAAKQMASRARRRVRETPVPDPDLTRQREVVDAFLAASRGGDFDALVAVLDPDVVARSDSGAVARGAAAVARQALAYVRSVHPAVVARPALVNGAMGMIGTVDGQPVTVLAFTITGGRIVEIDIFSGPDRLRRLDLTVLN